MFELEAGPGLCSLEFVEGVDQVVRFKGLASFRGKQIHPTAAEKIKTIKLLSLLSWPYCTQNKWDFSKA